MSLDMIKTIISETEKKIKNANARDRIEAKSLKAKGFTEVSLRQRRGWHKISLTNIKSQAYDEIVRSLSCSDSTTREVEE